MDFLGGTIDIDWVPNRHLIGVVDHIYTAYCRVAACPLSRRRASQNLMDVHHLRYFLAVAQERHFGRAAKRLGMSQPPLSARIRDLEREVGVRLFRRGPGEPVRLTAAGRALEPFARDIAARMDAAHAAVGRAARGEAGSLRVAVGFGTPPGLISTTAGHFGERFGNVHLTVSELSTDQQLEALAYGSVDVAICRHIGALDAGHLTRTRLARTTLGVAFRHDHPLAEAPAAKIEVLAATPVVVPAREVAPYCHERMLGFCLESGLHLDDVVGAIDPCRFVEVLHATGSSRAVALVTEGDARGRENLRWRPLAEAHLEVLLSAFTYPADDSVPGRHFLAVLATVAAAQNGRREASAA
jgi:DNA-binding transcriptional LysR family regulator